MLRVAHPQHHQQGDVQRGGLVERLVETGKYGKQPAEHTVQLGSLESEAQRPEQEATDSNHLGSEQAQGMTLEGLAAARQQQGKAVQQIDGPVGHDGPRPERHMLFPGKHQAADITALGGDPGGEAVRAEKQRRQ
ncbi:hypothetical protein D3C72_2009360 [compost metagenome]